LTDARVGRRLLAFGSLAAAGFDYPPGGFIPVMALESEVTRTDMKGKVWGAEALGTIHGAYAWFEENPRGSSKWAKRRICLVPGPQSDERGSVHAGDGSGGRDDGRRSVELRVIVHSGC